MCPDVYIEEDEDEEEEDDEEENDVKMIKAATKRNTTVNVIVTNDGRNSFSFSVFKKFDHPGHFFSTA